MARSSNKYTDEIGAAIIEAVRGGAFRKHAAAAQGVTESALNHWLVRGREGVDPYAAFAIELDRAVAEDAIRNQSIINAAAAGLTGRPAGDWRAAAWCLERKHPTLYGARQVVSTPAPPAEVEPAAPAPVERAPAVYSPFKANA